MTAVRALVYATCIYNHIYTCVYVSPPTCVETRVRGAPGACATQAQHSLKTRDTGAPAPVPTPIPTCRQVRVPPVNSPAPVTITCLGAIPSGAERLREYVFTRQCQPKTGSSTARAAKHSLSTRTPSLAPPLTLRDSLHNAAHQGELTPKWLSSCDLL